MKAPTFNKDEWTKTQSVNMSVKDNDELRLMVILVICNLDRWTILTQRENMSMKDIDELRLMVDEH